MTHVNYDLTRLVAAVQLLVDDVYYRHRITKLRNTVDKPRALPFKDEVEVLNELLVVGRQSPAAMEECIKLAEYKRTGKPKYMASYMAVKRRRDKKIVQLEELLTGRKFKHDEQVQLRLRQYDGWNQELERLLAKHGDATWKEVNQIKADFWDAKEAELDELITAAKAEHDRTVTRKRTVVVERTPKTAFGAKLKDAMATRKTLHKKH